MLLGRSLLVLSKTGGTRVSLLRPLRAYFTLTRIASLLCLSPLSQPLCGGMSTPRFLPITNDNNTVGKTTLRAKMLTGFVPLPKGQTPKWRENQEVSKLVTFLLPIPPQEVWPRSIHSAVFSSRRTQHLFL